jgi:hypothetical protein
MWIRLLVVMVFGFGSVLLLIDGGIPAPIAAFLGCVVGAVALNATERLLK